MKLGWSKSRSTDKVHVQTPESARGRIARLATLYPVVWIKPRMLAWTTHRPRTALNKEIDQCEAHDRRSAPCLVAEQSMVKMAGQLPLNLTGGVISKRETLAW